MSTELTVALVYEQVDGVEALKAALANAGVLIAAECRASELNADAILGSGADAIVVNLDADLADLLDEVTDALDASERPVIYNDPTASSDLSGWDRARWMRHLSAKLKGNTDVTPPAPPGAQAIPAPVPRRPAVAAAPVAGSVVDTSEALGDVAVDLAAEAETLPVSPVEVDVDMMMVSFDPPLTSEAKPLETSDNFEDFLDLSFEPAQDLVGTENGDGGELSTGALELDLCVEDTQAPASDAPLSTTLELPVDRLHETPVSDALTIGDEIADLDALFDGPPPTNSDHLASDSDQVSGLDELDSLFSAPPEEQSAIPGIIEASELNDLDAMFKDFEASQAESSSQPKEPASESVPEESAADSGFKGSGLNLDWSLEPIEEPAPAVPESAVMGANYEWRLDGGTTPQIAKTVPPAPAPPAKPEPSGPVIPADLEASLALADFQLMDVGEDVGSAGTPAPDALADEFDTLDLSSIDLDIGDAVTDMPSGVGDSASDTDLGFTELDFDLGLDVDDAPATGAVEVSDAGNLDELDMMFVPAQSAPALGLNLPDLNRLFVLGASIGGPEAIKAFLSRIPADIAATFVVAQHMGAEFLEMMAAQLNAATPLSVRYPKAGERLRHGEVVVAPATEEISIDDTGHLQFSSISASSPYNPSIDQLVRNATDRFGDQVTLILFSGMGTDAVDGGRYLSDRGGQVWAQDRATCVIASMIDAAKSQGIVKFEGTPAQLAERVLASLA